MEPGTVEPGTVEAAGDTDAESRDAAVFAAAASVDTTGTEAAEVDQNQGQDQDLEQEDLEKQPMTGGSDRSEEAPSASSEVFEKNGAIKLKIQDEEEEAVKFTGLTKEELLRVAGTPGWVSHTQTHTCTHARTQRAVGCGSACSMSRLIRTLHHLHHHRDASKRHSFCSGTSTQSLFICVYLTIQCFQITVYSN